MAARCDVGGMRANTSTEIFEERIEQLVREQIAAIRARAQAAVARGLGALAVPASVPASKDLAPQAKRSSPRPASRRRTAQQVADLAERLCAAVHAQPGETMRQLAPQVGATPSALSIAVERLRSQGRLRTVGHRQFTRYFPTAPARRPSSGGHAQGGLDE